MATTPADQSDNFAQPSGSFERQTSSFRSWVSTEPGAEFPAASGRYHLYVSHACPWAHRTMIARAVKGLEGVLSVTVVDPIRDDRGWAFRLEPDPINGHAFLKQAYLACDPSYRARATVPVLWDKERNRLVNNESADILRMLGSAFDAWAERSVDLYPEALRGEIDALNAEIYERVNNGVYRAGFATTQQVYEAAVRPLFETLDALEERLEGQTYLLASEAPTEADWRLFTTLIRFDAVYHGHFKCNLQRLIDYPRLSAYVRRLREVPGVEGTIHLDHIKRHYYETHRSINPSGVVPLGPLRIC